MRSTGSISIIPGSDPVLEPDLIRIPESCFVMGSDKGQDCERPIHQVRVDSFVLAATQVTNEEYGQFLRATSNPRPPFWADPNFNHPRQPVTGVSWHEATSYCEWLIAQTGRHFRLPTEAEWECAARGGLVQKRFAWGDELTPSGKHMCNIWQGKFPMHDTGEDGYIGTAPAKSFLANGYGLYNVAGNIWEWCHDWFSPTYHATAPRTDPVGPSGGGSKVVRGGSYLCHHSYCNRYRVGARTANTPDSSTGNTGFRCVRDV